MEFFSAGAEGYLEKTFLYHPITPHTLSNPKHRAFPGVSINGGWLCVGAVSFQTEEMKPFQTHLNIPRWCVSGFLPCFSTPLFQLSTSCGIILQGTFTQTQLLSAAVHGLTRLWEPRWGSPSEGAGIEYPLSARLPPLSLYGLEIGSRADSLWLVWGRKTMTSTAKIKLYLWWKWEGIQLHLQASPQTD